MLTIRKNPDVKSTVYITDVNIKVPADGSWIEIPITLTKSILESAANLRQAYDYKLVDIDVLGSYREVPNWFYEPYRYHVKVPIDILTNDNVETVLQVIEQYRKDAHPVMWYIIKTGLLVQESRKAARPLITAALEQESDYRRNIP